MSEKPLNNTEAEITEAVQQLQKATAAKKCWPCGCLHHSLDAIESAFPTGGRADALSSAIGAARERLAPIRYDCLGCEVCYPALAVNALSRSAGGVALEVDSCAAIAAVERDGWPPLPGDYTALRYRAPVAVCALTDGDLASTLAAQGRPEVAIVGTLQTENLGIERVITNVLANPHIRFLVVCGADSRQAIGHLPGQSIMALARSGLNGRLRIVGAPGKRPILRNLSRAAIEHFRQTVEIIDLVNNDHRPTILDVVRSCADRNPGPAEPFAVERVLQPIRGYVPEQMVSDPAGYLVVYVDRARGLLSLEHYRNDGVLDTIVEAARQPSCTYRPSTGDSFRGSTMPPISARSSRARNTRSRMRNPTFRTRRPSTGRRQ
jgi:tetrahydromethanopterin S-methyltransferase subunit A